MDTKPGQSHYHLPAPYNHYHGSKGGGGVYQTIINQMPPHAIYCEPFAGSAAIFRRKKLAPLSLLADLDRPLIVAHAQAMVAGQPGQEQCVAEAVSRWAGNGFRQDVFFGQITRADGSKAPGQVKLLNDDYREVCDLAVGLSQSTPRKLLTYFDPPYPLDSRRSHEPRYAHELSDQDHRSFLDYAVKMPGDVLISTYPNELYHARLKDWRLIEFVATTRGGPATEWLFCNFDDPRELHDDQYVGTDYRDRQNKKRTLESMARKLSARPSVVQYKMLHQLQAMLDELPFVPQPPSLNRLPPGTGQRWVSNAPPTAEVPLAAAVPLRPDGVLAGGQVWVVKVCDRCQTHLNDQKADKPGKLTSWGYALAEPDVYAYQNAYVCAACRAQEKEQASAEMPVSAASTE